MSSLPFAFAEQSIANLSSILNSDKAIEVNTPVMKSLFTSFDGDEKIPAIR